MGDHQELVPSMSRVPNLTVGSDPPPLQKKKRNLPGNPDPDAEVIALSPKTLMATNRFVCEICGKGFQRDQNLQLHRRGHNLPWKLKQKSTTTTTTVVRKRVYICPEKSCVHHHPSRALGDLTGIKKHFSRKHGEKKWECEKCSKKYAVQSDWKAHSKICGSREYKCDCGAIFSRRDSFVTHRAFCNALAEETARVNGASTSNHCNFNIHNTIDHNFMGNSLPSYALHPDSAPLKPPFPLNIHETVNNPIKPILSLCPVQDIIPPCVPCSSDQNHGTPKPSDFCTPSVPALFSFQQITRQTNDSRYMSATALLQKAAQVGGTSGTTRQYSILANIGLEGSNSYIKDNNNSDDYNGKFCGLYGSNLVPSSALENEVVDHPGNDGSSTLIINPMETYAPPVKRQKTQIEGDKDEDTRDFLVVGVNPVCNTSSINGWA